MHNAHAILSLSTCHEHIQPEELSSTAKFLRRRYGLVGPNGSGKSTLLKALGNREVPIPEHIDIYFLDREIPASDMTALEAVMSVDQERQRLEKEAEGLIADESEEAQARLEDVYER